MNDEKEPFVRNRNQKTEEAFNALESACKCLSELEGFAVATADGKFPDIGQIVHCTHTLRGAVDTILVGLVEARAVPERPFSRRHENGLDNVLKLKNKLTDYRSELEKSDAP